MTFAPLIPASGVVGYKILTGTETAQRTVFEAQPALAREVDYFTRNIAAVTSADELVSDRRLLRVALGAFGLDEDIDKGAFIKKILAEGVEDPNSFANRFVDPRYKNLSEAFGFGSLVGPKTGFTNFARDITSAYTERQFEISVGDQDDSLRLALNFRREIQTYATANDPDGTAWLSVLGDLPVRAVFEGAFGLSSSFSQIDIDRQQAEMRNFNNRTFGSTSLDIFTDPAKAEEVITRFLARRSAEAGPSASTPGFTALTILSASQNGAGATSIQNIILSSVNG